MNRRHFLGVAAAATFTTILIGPALAGKSAIYTGIVEGVGAGGYDVVSYFSGTPLAGSQDITSQWEGATWRFANVQNKAAFDADPARYAPQYGGYCAYAVAKGSTAKGDPEAWSVVDGKLYLNLSQSIRATWQQDIPANIAAGNANWPKVLE